MHLHLTGRSSSERTEFCAGTGKRYAKVRVNVNGQPESSILVGPHMRGVLGNSRRTVQALPSCLATVEVTCCEEGACKKH